MKLTVATTALLVTLSTAAPQFGAPKQQAADQVCTYTPVNSPFTQCGVEGNLLVPLTINTFSANNDFATCRTACEAASQCLSYSYDSKKNQCKTYYGIIAGQWYVKGSTGVNYWSKSCFTKTCVPKPTTSTIASSSVKTPAPSSTPAVSTPAPIPAPSSSTAAQPTSTPIVVVPSSSSSSPIITPTPTKSSTPFPTTTNAPSTISSASSTDPTLIPSSAASCPPAPTSTCNAFTATNPSSSLGSTTYTLQFAGTGKTLDPANPANNDPNFPPVTTTYAGSLSECEAGQQCAEFTWDMGTDPYSLRYSFDLHYVKSKGWWECVSYYNSQDDMKTWYTVADPEVCSVFGYSSPYYA